MGGDEGAKPLAQPSPALTQPPTQEMGVQVPLTARPPAAAVSPIPLLGSCSSHFSQEALRDSPVVSNTFSGFPELPVFTAVDDNCLVQGVALTCPLPRTPQPPHPHSALGLMG